MRRYFRTLQMTPQRWLKNAGFVLVDSRLDLRAADTRRALRDFADQARDGDVAVVYHAGHGIEIDGSFWAGQKNPAPGNTTCAAL
jgi:uncharacterized caspase-like protein